MNNQCGKSVGIVLAAFLFCLASGVELCTASDKIMREGVARYREFKTTDLPSGTSNLFRGEIVGNTFDLFVRNVDAQTVNIEIGLVDTDSTGPQQHAFSLSANGSPLDANIDVWQKAGGAFKPWVYKTTFNHTGGALAIQFAGLGSPGFVSYLRITDQNGKELAAGTAEDWKKGERLGLLDSRSRPFHKVQVGKVPFYDVDHSPVGAWSTLIYGMENSGGVQVCKQPGGDGTLVPDQGIIVAVKRGKTERLMPFASQQKLLPKEALITEGEVTRTLGACTDNWQIPMGVSWTHYTPVWSMKDWDTASIDEKRRFVIPVTWMQYRIVNSYKDGTDEDLLFSLEQPAVQSQGWNGFTGYIVDGDSSIAVKAGDAELLTPDQAKQQFNVDGATSAFCVHVPPGEEKVVTFYVAQYREGITVPLEEHTLKMMHAVLFSDINDILKSAQADLPAVISQCSAMDKKLNDCGQDEERKFLAADSLHSYQYNTILYSTEKNDPVWAVIEGECSCINTFDLTVDHVFYELAMHPWTVRNELDHFSYPFSYVDDLNLAGNPQTSPGGIVFCHDMGSRMKFSNHEKGAPYSTMMSQEELQNWIICAALYWKTTGDNAWLEKNHQMFKDVLKSMQLRDDLDPAKRDGITTYISNHKERHGEITTYDAMDASLRYPQDSLYITGKSFACYAMLKPVFTQLGEPELAKEAQDAEGYTARGILCHWDQSRQMFPATFDGKSSSAIIPAIEGLAYPYAMGLKEDVSLDGPNADLIRHLKMHLNTILVPGVCIDAQTGAWNLSSSSSTTWQSKVYLSQYVAENVLGAKSAATGINADSAHYAYQVLGSPAVCYTDQIYTGAHIAYGCRHYPRGVTSALWWLWPPTP